MSCKPYTSGLQQSTTRADETAAIAALHSISIAQRTYSISNNGNYGTFAQLNEAGYLNDPRFNAERPNVKGYVLTMTVSNRDGSGGGAFSVNADPETTGPQAGGRHLYLDSAGMIHANATQPAAASDPSLDQ
jgi:hypothetical protein